MPRLRELAEHISDIGHSLFGPSNTPETKILDEEGLEHVSKQVSASVEDVLKAVREERGAGTSGWDLLPGSVLN